MKAISISEKVDQTRGAQGLENRITWVVTFDEKFHQFVSGVSGVFLLVEIREWLIENLPKDEDDRWNFMNANSLVFKNQEDALLCFIRFAG